MQKNKPELLDPQKMSRKEYVEKCMERGIPHDTAVTLWAINNSDDENPTDCKLEVIDKQ